MRYLKLTNFTHSPKDTDLSLESIRLQESVTDSRAIRTSLFTVGFALSDTEQIQISQFLVVNTFSLFN